MRSSASAAMIIGRLGQAGAVDAVYLDLHGAMVTEHVDDGEGEMLARVRAVVGPEDAGGREPRPARQRDAPHGRASPTRLIAYRTYPHIDMAETGERAAQFLLARLRRPGAAARRAAPIAVPDSAADRSARCWSPRSRSTRELASTGRRCDAPRCPSRPVFRWPTFPSAAWRCSAYGAIAEARATRRRDAAQHRGRAREGEFDARVYTPEEGVRRAIAHRARRRASRSCSPTRRTIPAPAATATPPGCCARWSAPTRSAPHWDCSSIRDGRTGRARGRARRPASSSRSAASRDDRRAMRRSTAASRVERLSEGRFTCTGPFYRGVRMNLGPCARALRIGGVRVVVASRQGADGRPGDVPLHRHRADASKRYWCNKSSVHFRADFAPIAEEMLVCKAPGPMLADPSEFPWKNLAPRAFD